MRVIEIILMGFACVGVLWFVISTINDAGRRLFGRNCTHDFNCYDAGDWYVFSCMWCSEAFQVPKAAYPESYDPTRPLPEDDQPKLRVIRGGKES